MISILTLIATLLCARVPDALHTSPNDLAPEWRPTCETIAIESARMGIDPAVAIAAAWFESRLNPNAIGARGEVGALQAMPRWMHGCDGDALCGGLTALRHYIRRYPDGTHWCRYRGARAGCASERLRGGMAMRLRGGAEWH
jgi:hypothetical protein